MTGMPRWFSAYPVGMEHERKPGELGILAPAEEQQGRRKDDLLGPAPAPPAAQAAGAGAATVEAILGSQAFAHLIDDDLRETRRRDEQAKRDDLDDQDGVTPDFAPDSAQDAASAARPPDLGDDYFPVATPRKRPEEDEPPPDDAPPPDDEDPAQ